MKKKLFTILLSIVLLIGLSGCKSNKKEEYYCCNEGDSLIDGKCESIENMTTDVVYTCPDGYTAKTDGVCYRSDGKRGTFAKVTYSCPDGGSLVGNKCVKYHFYTPNKCDKPMIEGNNNNIDYEKEINIDNYIGKDYVSVKNSLESQMVTVIIEKTQSSEKENTVVYQSLAPGKYKIEDELTIILKIPDITNLYPDFTNGNYTINDVVRFADNNGLVLSIIKEQSILPSGTIISQSKEAGTKVMPDTQLKITVAE